MGVVLLLLEWVWLVSYIISYWVCFIKKLQRNGGLHADQTDCSTVSSFELARAKLASYWSGSCRVCRTCSAAATALSHAWLPYDS